MGGIGPVDQDSRREFLDEARSVDGTARDLRHLVVHRLALLLGLPLRRRPGDRRLPREIRGHARNAAGAHGRRLFVLLLFAPDDLAFRIELLLGRLVPGKIDHRGDFRPNLPLAHDRFEDTDDPRLEILRVAALVVELARAQTRDIAAGLREDVPLRVDDGDLLRVEILDAARDEVDDTVYLAGGQCFALPEFHEHGGCGTLVLPFPGEQRLLGNREVNPARSTVPIAMTVRASSP